MASAGSRKSPLDGLEGWRGSRPVRIGNAAERQFQADMYGMIVELVLALERARPPTPSRITGSSWSPIIETTIDKWREPDRGIWEVRSRPLHFVHSKVMCWAALDGGIALARSTRFGRRVERWQQAQGRVTAHIETTAWTAAAEFSSAPSDQRTSTPRSCCCPRVDFVAYDDPMMLRTMDAIRRDCHAMTD